MVKKELWRPTPKQMNNAHITRFIHLCNKKYSLEVNDYSGLYQWSINYKSEFWDTLWLFANIKAKNKGERIVINQEKMPGAKWFPDARLNYAENLLKQRDKQQLAIIFHNENGLINQLSYQDIYHKVAQLAQAMIADGVEPGDRIAGVLPNLPETVISMLATASIGAIWSSCSPDFGVAAIVDRFNQINPKILFVCDGYYFNGKTYNRFDLIDSIIRSLPTVSKTVLIPYINSDFDHSGSNLTLWQEYIADHPSNSLITYTQMAFDDPLFILFSSGTTGPPKCIVHGVGGTLLQHQKEHLLHVDIHPGEKLFYYTTCGWMMWNWLVSGLASAATLVLYDGSPLYPRADILFDLIDSYKINVFGISAKYLDKINKSSIVAKDNHKLSSLKTILSTGSPLAPERFDYVYNNIKSDLCLSSISGGTDIISCFVLGSPILPVYRGEIQCPGLAMQVDVFNEYGNSIPEGQGELVCTAPFPSMPVRFWNDPGQQKYHAAYFEKFPGIWCHGDYVSWTEHGGMIIYGRSDAILNPGGVRIGTAEIYRQVEQLDEVQESLVIDQQCKDECQIILFVVLRQNIDLSEQLKTRICQQIRNNTSPHHIPSQILQVTDIPRTKSGKIMELAVRNIFHQLPLKNFNALANPESLKQYEEYAKERARNNFDN